MLVAFEDVLREARVRGSAAGAFTCYDLETAAAVLETAASRDRAVILLVSPSTATGDLGDAYLTALLGCAAQSAARVCVQVDHIDDLALVERVLALGAGAVMVDGSRRPLEQNIALVAEAVQLAAPHRAAIEAELGHIDGNEDVAVVTRAGAMTDPVEAARLLAEARPACLAVSIGNVHGRYTAPPHLDWKRLEAIRARTDAPLSLHGASGIPEDSVRRAIQGGIEKVNVNTELREAYLHATGATVDVVRSSAAVVELHRAQRHAVGRVVAAKLELYDRDDVVALGEERR